VSSRYLYHYGPNVPGLNRFPGVIKVSILVLLLCGSLPFLYNSMPDGTDWHRFFRPAALALLHGENPYAVPGYYNPPWLLLPLLPIAVLPPPLGRLVLFLVSLAGFVTLTLRLKASPLASALFLAMPPVLICLNDGNVDWLPMLSVTLPAPWALIVAASKPQLGLGLSVYYLVHSWRTGGIRMIAGNFWPVTLLGILSVVLYGLPPNPVAELSLVDWNRSLFPYGLPVGLLLLWEALRHDRPLAGMGASPFFSPYVGQFTWAAPITLLLPYPRLLIVAGIVLWVPVLLQVLRP
jgi:hypothetical protein